MAIVAVVKASVVVALAVLTYGSFFTRLVLLYSLAIVGQAGCCSWIAAVWLAGAVRVCYY